jgi:hypothetical protein
VYLLLLGVNQACNELNFDYIYLVRRVPILLFLISSSLLTEAQLPGFTPTGSFDERELRMKGSWHNVTITINAPGNFNREGKTYIILYALPNGNSIEWTKGKKMKPGDDWHFDIQHIAAQTRFIRATDKENNYVVAYLATAQKSWPAWKRSTPNANILTRDIIDSLYGLFKEYDPKIILNGHSGGGSFIFGYLDGIAAIADKIECIAFLDSDYGYIDSLHSNKLINWLNQNNRNRLAVLAYNDSLVIFNGKALVSPTGGTWYRSRLMHRALSSSFSFSTVSDTAFIKHEALDGRILIMLKQNPAGFIYHTEQVARNGFILSILFATKFNKPEHFIYFGERAYENYIDE